MRYGRLYYTYNTEDIMKKILIKHNGIKFEGYLIEDLPTKFRALNETKMVEWHYPKSSYSYKVMGEE